MFEPTLDSWPNFDVDQLSDLEKIPNKLDLFDLENNNGGGGD